METLDVKERFIELRAQGWSFNRIAKELRKTKQTLINWSKELQEEIATQKALELEGLYEKFYLHREARLEMFGDMLRDIKKELKTRNLKDVSTEKLMDLLLRYEAQVREELIEPRFMSSDEIEEEKINKTLLDELTKAIPKVDHIFTNGD